MNITIKPLTHCKEHIPTLAKLWYEEISRHWVPDASIDKAQQRLVEHSNTNKLPLAIVALNNDQPVGMACLRITDGIRPNISPWLGSLVVDPVYRGNKIGEQLITEIKQLSRIYDFKTLHLLAFDPTIPNWYARLGWEMDGKDRLLSHEVTCMKISL